MSDSAFATIVGANLGSQLMEIMLCDGIEPGSSPSYETCKLIYLYHPMGAKLAEEPCRLAMSQQREISIPNSPETLIKEAFEKEWRALRCNQIILQVMTLSSVYGASALIYGAEDFPLNEPIDPKELAKLDIYFNVFDPLNVAGSLITNQAPNSPDFQKHGDISSNGKTYHRSRACVIYNEQPVYIAYSQSAFGYVGRSVYQRALYQLKGFINSMITDNHVQEKSGLLIIKSKKPGSIIDNIMTSVAAVKRSMLKGAKTGNVLEVGADDAVETLNMQNVDVAMTTSRTNIINNIALAAGRPAILLTEESYTKGFGEGTEDAKKVARFIDGYREEMQPLYEFLDPIIQYRAWSESFYETIQAQFSEYQAIPYETAIMQWKNSFVASWPNLLKEPDSEAIKVEETKFKAVNEAVLALKDDLDPDNKARLFEWMADCFNEQKLLFQNPLDLDFDAMVQYQEQQKAEQKEAEAQQMQQLQQGKQEGSFADSAPIPAGAQWITLEDGKHVLIGRDGKVIGGAGGVLDGKYYGSHGENSPNKTITKNYNEEMAANENKSQDNVAKSEKDSILESRSKEAGKPGDTTMNAQNDEPVTVQKEQWDHGYSIPSEAGKPGDTTMNAKEHKWNGTELEITVNEGSGKGVYKISPYKVKDGIIDLGARTLLDNRTVNLKMKTSDFPGIEKEAAEKIIELKEADEKDFNSEKRRAQRELDANMAKNGFYHDDYHGSRGEE